MKILRMIFQFCFFSAIFIGMALRFYKFKKYSSWESFWVNVLTGVIISGIITFIQYINEKSKFLKRLDLDFTSLYYNYFIEIKNNPNYFDNIKYFQKKLEMTSLLTEKILVNDYSPLYFYCEFFTKFKFTNKIMNKILILVSSLQYILKMTTKINRDFCSSRKIKNRKQINIALILELINEVPKKKDLIIGLHLFLDSIYTESFNFHKNILEGFKLIEIFCNYQELCIKYNSVYNKERNLFKSSQKTYDFVIQAIALKTEYQKEMQNLYEEIRVTEEILKNQKLKFENLINNHSEKMNLIMQQCEIYGGLNLSIDEKDKIYKNKI